MNRRPESFNEVAELYDRARPLYPLELLDDVCALTGVMPGGRVLEIGAGTGQMTAPLAARGLLVTALEPGTHLAEVVRRKLPTVEVIESRFEDYALPPEPFDLVISATAFHWVDPEVRVAKARAALAADGHLAIVETHWGVSDKPDELSALCQPCFDRWDPETAPGFVAPVLADLPTTRADLDESPDFEGIWLGYYQQVNAYDTAGYLDLLRSWSNVLGLDETGRQGLLGCIGDVIDRQFSGQIRRVDTRALWLARAVEPYSG